MRADITFYGQLTDATGTDKLAVEGSHSTDELIAKLTADFPGLKSRKYIIAVNNEIVKENIPLSDNDRVSFLPPFSGG